MYDYLKNLASTAFEEPSMSETTFGLSTGCSVINLALSDHVEYGLIPGKYYMMVGDSSAGKTLMAMTLFAEACANPAFDNYSLIYDDVEGGCLFDIEKMFGKKLKSRLKAPRYNEDGEPQNSITIEEFYANLDDCLASGPCIYILDSQDSLTSYAEMAKFLEDKEAIRKGKALGGSYGDGKSKVHSGGIRKMLDNIKTHDSILIILNQTRDNIGFGFEKSTYSGGRALKFYASAQIWLSLKEKIKKTINGKMRTVGHVVAYKIKKNRINGNEIDLSVPLYTGYGIDDVGNNIDYLLDEKHWTKSGQKINATEFELSCTKEKLIDTIEEQGKEAELQAIVAQVWAGVLAETSTGRKSKYE